MRDHQIKVSVLCAAYNHEKYIRQCLEGFVSQKTDFNFEVLINDDASTDNTAKIIKEYEEKYPEIIKPIYQKENQHSKKIKINPDILFPHAKGKYIAFCEGDDYWTDPCKLQKQVDALEKNPDCFMCLCRVDVVEEDDTYSTRNKNRIYTEPTGIISSARFIKILNPYLYQLSGYVLNSEQLGRYYQEIPEFKKLADVGDLPLLLYFGQLGKVYFINEAMSHYRINSIGSWHDLNQNTEKQLIHFEKMINMLHSYDEYTNFQYHQECMNRILEYQMKIASLKNNYKMLFEKSNKNVIKAASVKRRVKLFLYRISPKLAKKIERMLSRK